MLGAVIVAGIVLAFEPGQNALDSWGFSVFPGELHSRILGAVTDLGLAPVAGTVAVVCAAVAWRHDRRRAIACVVGPALAVLLTEVLKEAVGRKLEGALCYPSGTTAVVTAVVAVVVLVTKGPVRVVAFAAGAMVALAEAAAVVTLRWHYPSDALAGIVLGVGTVVLADAVLHLRRTAPPTRARRTLPSDNREPGVHRPPRS
jgi:membrane-associated phospholipid phosphatase